MGRSFDEAGFTRVRDVSLDVVEVGDAVEVTADLPGYDKSDLDVSVHGRQLTIAAEREESTDVDEANYIRQERRHRAVSRTVTLPVEVRREEVSATYRNGVLTVTLPKVEPDGDDSHSIDIE